MYNPIDIAKSNELYVNGGHDGALADGKTNCTKSWLGTFGVQLGLGRQKKKNKDRRMSGPTEIVP